MKIRPDATTKAKFSTLSYYNTKTRNMKRRKEEHILPNTRIKSVMSLTLLSSTILFFFSSQVGIVHAPHVLNSVTCTFTAPLTYDYKVRMTWLAVGKPLTLGLYNDDGRIDCDTVVLGAGFGGWVISTCRPKVLVLYWWNVTVANFVGFFTLKGLTGSVCCANWLAQSVQPVGPGQPQDVQQLKEVKGPVLKQNITIGGITFPIDVAGAHIPTNKLGLLAPYIGLTLTIMVATVATALYVKRVKRREEKQ